MSTRRQRRFVGVIGLAAAIAGVAIAEHVGSDSHGGLKPYGLQETLPQMAASFGGDARIVEVIVGSSGVYYQVIGPDHRLHIRDYSIVESEIEAGTYGYNRTTRDFVRALTPAESRSAVVTLGQVNLGVVDSLYGKVGFPRQGSSATLTGRSWFLQSGAQPEHRFVAAYSGSGLQRTQAAAPPDPDAATIRSLTPATTPTSSNGSTAPGRTVQSFTTTISSGPAKPGNVNRITQRLMTCIAHSQGDVNKIAACQRRFVP